MPRIKYPELPPFGPPEDSTLIFDGVALDGPSKLQHITYVRTHDHRVIIDLLDRYFANPTSFGLLVKTWMNPHSVKAKDRPPLVIQYFATEEEFTDRNPLTNRVWPMRIHQSKTHTYIARIENPDQSLVPALSLILRTPTSAGHNSLTSGTITPEEAFDSDIFSENLKF